MGRELAQGRRFSVQERGRDWVCAGHLLHYLLMYETVLDWRGSQNLFGCNRCKFIFVRRIYFDFLKEVLVLILVFYLILSMYDNN